MTRVVIAAWLLALLAAPARAADHPPIVPQRDVDVTYDVTAPAGGPAMTQRMRWSTAAGRLRVDPPTKGIYMIVDYRNKRLAVVKPEQQAVLDLPGAGPGMPGAAAGAYTRQGADQVAGLPCTVWQTADAAGQDTLLCLTADGVMLRASQGGRVLLQAASVTYAAQDPADFIPPDGFTHIAGASQ